MKLISKAFRMVRVNKGSHSFTCHPHEWNEPSWRSCTSFLLLRFGFCWPLFPIINYITYLLIYILTYTKLQIKEERCEEFKFGENNWDGTCMASIWYTYCSAAIFVLFLFCVCCLRSYHTNVLGSNVFFQHI